MSYTHEEVKTITDKVLNMAKADAVEVRFSGGERSATRYANSTITANLVEHDQEVLITVYYGQKSATTSTHQFDNASLQSAIEQAQELAKRRPDNPELMPLVRPPQDYLSIDGALPQAVAFGPAERARMVKQSVDVCEKKGVLGSGYIPKLHWTDALANSEGLFAYYRYAEASFILTCRTPDGTGSGWAGTTGLKDISKIEAADRDVVAEDLLAQLGRAALLAAHEAAAFLGRARVQREHHQREEPRRGPRLEDHRVVARLERLWLARLHRLVGGDLGERRSLDL